MEDTEPVLDAPAPLGPWSKAAWLLLVVLAAAIPVLVASHVFPTGSPDRDDAGYLSQANALRAGRLTLPADEHDPFFLPFLSGVDGDRVVFKYQPAWPALIAASDAVTGTPKTALAVTGVASALAVAALAFEVTLRRRAALAAGFVFATSPWFFIQSGTYLAYPASTALLCGATALVVRAARTGTTRLWVAAGAVMALGVFHRPFDAVLGLAPLGVWFLLTRWRSGSIRRDVGWIALGAAPFAALFFAYNRAVTGRAYTLAFSLVGPNDRFGFGPRSSLADPGEPGFYDFTPGEAWRTALGFAGSLLDWLPGGLLAVALAVVGFVAVRRRGLRWLIVAQGLVFPLGYFVWWGAANAWSYGLHDLLGPLYWFPLLASVSVLGGAGIDRLAATRPGPLRGRSAPGIVVVAIGLLVATSLVTSGDSVRAVKEARDNEIDMAEALRPGPGTETLTIAPRTFEGDIYVPVPVPSSLDADHLVGMDATEGDRRFELLDRFPDRTIVDTLKLHGRGQPFDAGTLTRQQLSVTSGPTVTLTAEVIGAGEVTASVGGDQQVLDVVDGTVQVTVAAEATPGALVVPEGGPIDVVISVDDHELHYRSRSVDGEVQVIEPPTPIRHYAFPGHEPADIIEDVWFRIRPA
ncbi:hypothetical protein ACE2AJ_04600 [Aquihabitans daechungensis]|uniref:hypothetical protein n=1 Tax=Aquihabitans daechungensis TaxID=1052257 RepID=UPI003B9E3DC7